MGVNSDDTIIACKGPPVCGDKERVATVKGNNDSGDDNDCDDDSNCNYGSDDDSVYWW